MRHIFDKFFPTSLLSSETCRALNRNFERANEEEGPYVVTTNLTLTERDQVNSVQVNATGGNRIVILPSPTGNRRRTVTKTDVSANTVTVNAGSSTINGAATYVLAAQYDSVTIEPTNTTWLIVASYP